MGVGGSRRFVAALVAGLALLAVLTAAPPTIAQPAGGGAVADAPTLALPTLGADPDIALYGLQGTQTLMLPVPPGLAPDALNAIVELPPNVRAGSIAVTQNTRTLSRVDLPSDRAPISIPLAGAEIVDNAITVLLLSQLLPPDGYCLYDTTIPLRLVDAAVAYSGRELAPTVIADFLPPVLERLTIFVPESPTRAESDAAVRLTTAVVARYGEQRPQIGLAPLPGQETGPPAPSAPLERNIVVREGPDAAVSLQGSEGVPALLITGSADDLVNQSRLLTSDMARLALSSKAVVGPISSAPQLPPNVTTIRDLGQPGVNATALKPQVTIGLDQTKLGRPVKDVRVQLKGSYTPLPSSVGGQVVASVGGQSVDRWPIDSSGVIDRWISIPNSALQRYTNLGVAIDISGNTGRCGEFQPVTLTIDGATTVESVAAQPAPLGFQSLPQALMPRAQVGLGEQSFADTRRAVAIMEGLQRLSALPIDTVVAPIADAMSARTPAVVISADGWTNDSVQLPVASMADGELEVETPAGDRTTLRLEPGLRFGLLQTVYDDNRALLIATSNDNAAELDSLLGWLDSDSRRWARLSGPAVIAPEGQQPVTLAGEPPSPDADASEAKSDPTWWFAAGAVVAAVAALLGWSLLRRRRRA